MADNQKISDLVVEGIVDYLKETRRENLLPQVTQILEQQTKNTKKAKEILVSSPISLEKHQLKSLKFIVSKLFRQDLPLVNKINKNLIGGFTLKVGDWYLDASLSRELIDLKQSLLS